MALAHCGAKPGMKVTISIVGGWLPASVRGGCSCEVGTSGAGKGGRHSGLPVECLASLSHCPTRGGGGGRLARHTAGGHHGCDIKCSATLAKESNSFALMGVLHISREAVVGNLLKEDTWVMVS